jgi:hypothetical protein
MNLKNKLFLGLIGLALGAAVTAQVQLSAQDQSLIEKIQSGDLVLRCDMLDGTRNIEGGKVIDLFDGVWQFEGGGYASSCRILKP